LVPHLVIFHIPRDQISIHTALPQLMTDPQRTLAFCTAMAYEGLGITIVGEKVFIPKPG
jgi:hypothetical protein